MRTKSMLFVAAVVGLSLVRPTLAADRIVLDDPALDRIVAGDVQAKVSFGTTVVYDKTFKVDTAPLKGTIIDLPLWVPLVGTVTVKVVAL